MPSLVKNFKKIVIILFGTSLFAFGIVHFNMQNQLGEGGISGITLILYFKLNISMWISYLFLNIPIFFIGWKMLGRKAISFSLLGALFVTGWIAIFEKYHLIINLQDDLFLATILAGVFSGVGLGITFRYGGTTGGTDIIAQIIKKYHNISQGKTIFVIDIFVISISIILYLDYKQAVYTLIFVFIATRIIDFFNDGSYNARGVMIISSNINDIAENITKKMQRGVTLIRAHGYYSNQNRDIIYCVVEKREINKLKKLIANIDPHAFVTVSNVHDVLGEGFTFDAKKHPIERH